VPVKWPVPRSVIGTTGRGSAFVFLGDMDTQTAEATPTFECGAGHFDTIDTYGKLLEHDV